MYRGLYIMYKPLYKPLYNVPYGYCGVPGVPSLYSSVNIVLGVLLVVTYNAPVPSS